MAFHVMAFISRSKIWESKKNGMNILNWLITGGRDRIESFDERTYVLGYLQLPQNITS